MSQFFTLLTKTGQGLLANAIAYGQPLTIAEMAIGDGGGKLPTPNTSVTHLVNEVRRGPINQTAIDDTNPNWTVVEQVLPAEVGGWTIREVGLYDTAGNLIAYGNYPETYKPQLSEGSARTQTIRFVMEVTDTSAVTLKIDPSVVMASRQYVDNSLDEHRADAKAHMASAIALDAKLPGLGNDVVQVQQALAALGRLISGRSAGDTGEVKYFAFDDPPDGWLVCDGATVSRVEYAELFGAVGTRFGNGDGASTFNLPDLRKRYARGADDQYSVGAYLDDELRSHGHSGTTSTAGSHTHSAGPAPINSSGGSGAAYGSGWTGGYMTTSSSGNHSHGVTINATGGSETRPASVVLLPCIRH